MKDSKAIKLRESNPKMNICTHGDTHSHCNISGGLACKSTLCAFVVGLFGISHGMLRRCLESAPFLLQSPANGAEQGTAELNGAGDISSC